MGLFAFNRMRLKKVEEMKPENIEAKKKEKEDLKELRKEKEATKTTKSKHKRG